MTQPRGEPKSCVVLTPEEAAFVKAGLQVGPNTTGHNVKRRRALLSPDPEIFAPRDPHTYVTHEPKSSGAGELPAVESGEYDRAEPAPDDIGPPAPGEGDDLPNPEIGMEC